MPRLSLARWTLEVDHSATALAYSIFNEGDCERCGCTGCQNFIASRDSLYPDPVANFMRSGGIPRDREIGVAYHGEIRDGVHFYMAFFHFVGGIVDGADSFIPYANGNGGSLDLVHINASFSVGVTSRLSLIADSFPRESTVQLEFSVELPWLLPPDSVQG